MELRDVMRTTPATRAFTDEPVTDEVLYDILEHARFAPERGQPSGLEGDRRARLRDEGVGSASSTTSVSGSMSAFTGRVWSPSWRPTTATGSRSISRWPEPSLCPTSLPMSDRPGTDRDPARHRLCVERGQRLGPGPGDRRRLRHSVRAEHPPGSRERGPGATRTSVLARQEPALRRAAPRPRLFILATMIPLGKPVKEITKLRRGRGRGLHNGGCLRRPRVHIAAERQLSPSQPQPEDPGHWVHLEGSADERRQRPTPVAQASSGG